mmetsp:Transcript_70662/g.132243  ORF Transcript_70662/g.132243 Transcript_70662/m.132243 type:complete len:490 (-) Transcript_70662:84-1553(-)
MPVLPEELTFLYGSAVHHEASGSVAYLDEDDEEEFLDAAELFDEEDAAAEDGGTADIKLLSPFVGPTTAYSEDSSCCAGGAAEDGPASPEVDEYVRRGRPAKSATMPGLTLQLLRNTMSKNGLDGIEASGVFQKRQPHWVDGWRQRAYILRQRKLLYFDEAWPDRPCGVLDFGLLRFHLHCAWLEADEKQVRWSCERCSSQAPPGYVAFYLRPTKFPDKVFAFRGEVEAMKELASKLALLIRTELPGKMLSGNAAASKKNFWRYPFAKESTFLSEAESCDILLFRSRDEASPGARLQRSLTTAAYDHVGMVLRRATGELHVMEALGGEGVYREDWHAFLARGWHQYYSHIVWRKVYFRRSHQQMENLERFVASAIGAEYGLDMNKLFLSRKNSLGFDADGSPISPSSHTPTASPVPDLYHETFENPQEDNRTYFCSELVAACLKRVGVLAGSKASTQYWPGSFSQQSGWALPLQPDTFIGEELVIVLDM